MKEPASPKPDLKTLLAEIKKAYSDTGLLTAAARGDIGYHVRSRIFPHLEHGYPDFKLTVVLRAGELDLLATSEDPDIRAKLAELGFKPDARL